jgi:hypothetical protein
MIHQMKWVFKKGDEKVKIILSIVSIMILIFLCALIGTKAQERCEKSNGIWMVQTNLIERCVHR